jgi:hypothetical protein
MRFYQEVLGMDTISGGKDTPFFSVRAKDSIASSQSTASSFSFRIGTGDFCKNALESSISQGADADAARVRPLAAYKDFLVLWKDADPDIPILKAEYAKLK